MLHKSFIFMLLFLSLFCGGIISLGAPRYFAFSVEVLIVLLFLFSLFARSGKGIAIPHLWHIFFLFLVSSLFSIYLNDYPPTRSIFSLRLIFRFYFFYLAIIMMEPDDDLIKKINVFVLFLLVMEFPIVAVKLPQYGISERTAGAYAVHDGSIATMLPITLIFYLASFYFLHKPRISFVLIGIGYIICSIVGGKRAIFFLYPFQFVFIYYYIYVKGTAAHVSKKIIAFIMIAPFLIVLSGSILFFNKTLNPDQMVGGRVDLGYALEYAKRYNSGVDTEGYSFGRISTAKRTIEILAESGIPQLIFGLGPGIATKSLLDSKKEREEFDQHYDSFKIGYGRTTISSIALEYGIAGVLIFSAMLFSLTLMCFKLYQKETEAYWRAFASGSLWFSLSMVFFAFSYHHTAFLGDTMPVLYFYAMAVVYTRNYHRTSQTMNANP